MKSCPRCDGRKQVWVHLNYGPERPGKWTWIDCHQCDGTGQLDDWEIDAIAVGEAIADDRKARLQALREEAAEIGCDAPTLSKVEHGTATEDTIRTVLSLREKAGRFAVRLPESLR